MVTVRPAASLFAAHRAFATHARPLFPRRSGFSVFSPGLFAKRPTPPRLFRYRAFAAQRPIPPRSSAATRPRRGAHYPALRRRRRLPHFVAGARPRRVNTTPAPQRPHLANTAFVFPRCRRHRLLYPRPAHFPYKPAPSRVRRRNGRGARTREGTWRKRSLSVSATAPVFCGTPGICNTRPPLFPRRSGFSFFSPGLFAKRPTPSRPARRQPFHRPQEAFP